MDGFELGVEVVWRPVPGVPVTRYSSIVDLCEAHQVGVFVPPVTDKAVKNLL